MRKLLLLSIFVSFLSFQSQALAVRVVTQSSLEYYNFSSSTFSISGFQISINGNYFDVSSLTASGPLNVPAGDSIILSGLTIPAGGASIGLWSNGTFPGTPNATQLWSFMQFGSAGHEYEGIAVSAGLWQAGTYAMGSTPLNRDNDYTSWGSSHWTGTIGINEFDFSTIKINPNPFGDEFVISTNNNQSYTVDIVNVVGQNVLSVKAVKQKEIRVNTSLLESGVYLLRVSYTNGNQTIKRIVKN